MTPLYLEYDDDITSEIEQRGTDEGGAIMTWQIITEILDTTMNAYNIWYSLCRTCL